jgi:hypothetical protein
MSANADRGWSLQVERTANAAVAISMLPKYLSGEQIVSLRNQFARQSLLVDVVDIRKITGHDDKDALAGLYSDNELTERSGQLYLLLTRTGEKKTAVSLPAAALLPISTDLILLDPEAHPFFATTVRLLVPNNTR